MGSERDIVERLRAASLNPDAMRRGWLAEAIDEIERLRDIVERLPKTADGVPCAPGDVVYWWRTPKRARRVESWPWGTTFPLEGSGEHVPLGECYSTPEAAERAAEKESAP